MKKFIFLCIFALLLGASLNVSAQGYYGRRHRIRNEQRRIRQGVRSGQLTRTEAQQLRANERTIRAERRANRADGVVTADERRQIRANERAQSRTIYNYRHNGARRYYRNGRWYYGTNSSLVRARINSSEGGKNL